MSKNDEDQIQSLSLALETERALTKDLLEQLRVMTNLAMAHIQITSDLVRSNAGVYHGRS